MAPDKRSLAHLADKFNTDAPAGYVPGQGRGAGGFAQPPPGHAPRGRGASSSGAGPSSAAAGPAREVPAKVQFALGEEEKNTAVDIANTNAYEETGLSLDYKEAGYEVEPFNLDAERETGKFDPDGAYIPKRRRGRDELAGKGEDEDEDEEPVDASDAWLQSMDELKESDEKLAKRKRAARLAEERLERAEAEDDAAEVPALALECASHLEPAETVLQALRRLGGARGGARGRGGGGGGVASGGRPSAADRARFDALTGAASRLMAAGHVSVYSDTREALATTAGGAAGGAGGSAGGAPLAAGHTAAGQHGGGAGPDASAGYFLDEGSGVYFNAGSGFCFDPASQLHWDPSQQPPAYFYYNSAAQAYVPWQAAHAPAAANDAS